MASTNDLYLQAKHYIPGGVNSPVRAWTNLGREPIFIKSANGAYITDESDNDYIDYVSSWGANILGHSHPLLLDVIKNTAAKGVSFGAPSILETELAKHICNAVKSVDKIRFVNSGTEATMTAVRLARGFTGRDLVIKFDGCYHGHVDSLLVSAGSGVATHNKAASTGIPLDTIRHTISLPYNDVAALESTFTKYAHQIAAVIVEPIAGNMNFIRSSKAFLDAIARLCKLYKSVFIADEVMTGFRVAYAGAQSLYDIKPDLTCFGKIIGGGLPVGAVGGATEIMDYLSPVGSVYQAGTLSGNPLAMASGLAVLKELQKICYEDLSDKTATLTRGLKKRASKHGINMYIENKGAMFGFLFTELSNNNNYADIQQSNLALFKAFFLAMLQRGVYFAPSAFEAGFISLAHTSADIDATLHTAEEVFAVLRDDIA